MSNVKPHQVSARLMLTSMDWEILANNLNTLRGFPEGFSLNLTQRDIKEMDPGGLEAQITMTRSLHGLFNVNVSVSADGNLLLELVKDAD
jgi:hypothetical protein